jgi:hypothetical protein
MWLLRRENMKHTYISVDGEAKYFLTISDETVRIKEDYKPLQPPIFEGDVDELAALVLKADERNHGAK